MMTHANVLAVTSAVMTIVPGIGTKDIYMAYLPLAHILELAAEVWIICKLAGLHGHCNSMSSVFFFFFCLFDDDVFFSCSYQNTDHCI